MADGSLDVAVVGAGVVRVAIAGELYGRGVRAAVSGIGAGASGVQFGGVRRQCGTPAPIDRTLGVLDVARFEHNRPVPEP